MQENRRYDVVTKLFFEVAGEQQIENLVPKYSSEAYKLQNLISFEINPILILK